MPIETNSTVLSNTLDVNLSLIRSFIEKGYEMTKRISTFVRLQTNPLTYL